MGIQHKQSGIMVWAREISAADMKDGMAAICVAGDTKNDTLGLGLFNGGTVHFFHQTCPSLGYTHRLTAAATAGEQNAHGFKTVHDVLTEPRSLNNYTRIWQK